MRTFLLTLILWLPLCAMAQTEASTLVVALKSGATENYALAKKPVVTYSATTMTIAVEGLETTYEVNDVENFHFESNLEEDAIAPVKANFHFRQTAPNVFTIEGAETVRVCHASGQTLKTYTTAARTHIDLSTQPAGVYILSIQSKNKQQSIKIIKK